MSDHTLTISISQPTLDLHKKIYKKLTHEDQKEIENAIYMILKSVERKFQDDTQS